MIGKGKGFLAPLALGAAVLGLAGAAHGTIVIDDFTDTDGDPYPIVVDSLTSQTVDEFGLGGVLGGVRHTTVAATFLDLDGLDDVEVSVVTAGGLLDFASTSGAEGSLSLLYDGGGNLNADFGDEIGIEIDFAHFDSAAGDPMPVTITMFDGVNSAALTLSLATPGAQTVLFDFASFSGIDVLDLSSVDSVNVEFDGALATDFRITGITAIPGAGSLALLGVAGGLVGGRRRRR